MVQATKSLSLKLFAGFLLTSELKAELSQSKKWNLLKILPPNDRKRLTLTRFEGREYLGCYLAAEEFTVQELKIIEEELKAKVHELLHKVHPHRLQLNLFTQPFIA